MTAPISVTVSSGVAISAKSTSTTPRDHVGVFNLAADGGTNNAALNIVSANAAFSACEVSGHEAAHGTTGGTSGKVLNYVDSTGVTIFALLSDGSLLLRPLATPPAGTQAGLKLCNVNGTLGVVDSTGTFTPLT